MTILEIQYPFLAQQLSVLFLSAWFAILFLQSGLDKITDYKGNLSWLKSHFAKSLVKNTVPQMLLVVTITETLAGIICAAGFFYFLFSGNGMISFWGFALANLDLTMLFFGQRVNKDYVGAANLQAYFIVGIIGMFASGMMAF